MPTGPEILSGHRERRALKLKRKFVLVIAILDLVLSGVSGWDYYNRMDTTVANKNNEDDVDNIAKTAASQIYVMALLHKVAWALGTIFGTLRCKDSCWKYPTFLSAIVTRRVIGMAFLVLFVLSYGQKTESEFRRVRVYSTCMSFHLFLPSLVGTILTP